MPNVTTNPSVPQPAAEVRVDVAQPAAGSTPRPQTGAAGAPAPHPPQPFSIEELPQNPLLPTHIQQQTALPQLDLLPQLDAHEASQLRRQQLPQVSELDALDGDIENEPDVDGNNSDFADDDSEDGRVPERAVEHKLDAPTHATPLVIDVSTEPFAAIVDPTCPLTGHVTHRLLPNNGAVVDIGVLPPSIHHKDNVTYLLTLDNGLRVWNMDTLECVRSFELALHAVPLHLNITPNGQVGVMFKDRAGSTYDIFSGKSSENYDSYGHCSHFLSDGTYAVASAHYGASGPIVKVFYPGAAYQAAELKGHSKEVTAMVSLNDGRTLITGSKDRTIKVWDVVTSGWLQTFSGHQQVVTSVIVIDQNTIASGSGDCTIRIWDLRSGSCVRVLEGHKGWVWRLCLFGPNHIVSAAFDATLKIWEIDSGKCVGTLPNYRAPRCLKALPNGALAVGNWEGFVNIVR